MASGVGETGDGAIGSGNRSVTAPHDAVEVDEDNGLAGHFAILASTCEFDDSGAG